MYKNYYKFGNSSYQNQELGFDFRQLLLIRTDKICGVANECAISYDYNGWYQCLNTLKRIISFKCTESELIEIKKKLSAVRTKLKVFKNSELEKYKIEDELDKIEIELISKMYKYGLYYPKFKKQKRWEDEAKDEDK